MKSTVKRIILLALVCVLTLGALVGCSSRGKTLMKLDGVKISENTLMLLMSRMKGNMSSSYMFGTSALKDSFWDTVTDASSGKTYDAYYTNMVIDNAKTYLAALYLFEELDLKLPSETVDSIDEELDKLIDSDANGSKSAFNAILAEYGANYNILRDAYIMEAKIAYLSDHLFGADGSKISEDNYNDYYNQNYARFRQIFFFTKKPVYETDKQGDVIYYSDLQNKVIAYDSEAEGVRKKTDDAGKVLTDAKGQIIWVYTEGGVEHISYDDRGTEEKPTYPNPLLDDSGNVITAELDKSEMIALSDKVQLILEDEAREGEYALFDKLIEAYGEDVGMEEYPNGYYMTKESEYDSPEVVKALFEMNTGEIRRVESDYGIHIVMKYELDEAAYAKSENKDFFRAEDGTYSFLTQIKNQLLEEYIAKYKNNIEIDESILAGLSMKNVGANYNY